MLFRSKPLYGLKQAAHAWNVKLTNLLTGLGYVALESDPCVFVKRAANFISIVGAHVDDLIDTANSNTGFDFLRDGLHKHVEISDLGQATYVLGVHLIRDLTEKTITLSQKKYVIDILNRFDMMDSKPVRTPMSVNPALSKLDGPDRKSTRLNSSHSGESRMPSSA